MGEETVSKNFIEQEIDCLLYTSTLPTTPYV